MAVPNDTVVFRVGDQAHLMSYSQFEGFKKYNPLVIPPAVSAVIFGGPMVIFFGILISVYLGVNIPVWGIVAALIGLVISGALLHQNGIKKSEQYAPKFEQSFYCPEVYHTNLSKTRIENALDLLLSENTAVVVTAFKPELIELLHARQAVRRLQEISKSWATPPDVVLEQVAELEFRYQRSVEIVNRLASTVERFTVLETSAPRL